MRCITTRLKRRFWTSIRGVADVADKKLVMIGDPAERYQEDPVRILRAVRLSGKLGFEVEEQTALPIAEYAGRLKMSRWPVYLMKF